MSIVRSLTIATSVAGLALPMAAQTPAPSAYTRRFISVDAPVSALTHVRVIDGTGAAPREDQTVVMADRKSVV